MLIDILRGSARAELQAKGYDRLKTYGVGRDLPYKVWKEYLYQMIQLGYIEVDYEAGQVLRITPLGKRVLYGQQTAQLALYQEPEEEPKAKASANGFKAKPIRPKRATSVDDTLLDALKQLRKQLAERDKIPPYLVFTDASLESMVEQRPTTLDAFSDVHGVGQIKLDRYGRVFVSLIRFVLKLPLLQ